MEKKNGFKINSESINQKFFHSIDNVKAVLKRQEMRGAIIGIAGIMATFGVASSLEKEANTLKSEDTIVENIDNSAPQNNLETLLVGLGANDQFTENDVDLNEVNSLNIIINDDKCSNSFFSDVCEELNNDGLIFTSAQNCVGIDVDNSVVVTLDQLCLSGPGMVFFSPYDNERLGQSDALALGMEASFKDKGFLTDGIQAGKIGYRELKTGDFQSRVPTLTEESIGTDKNTSFLTIAFGTSNFDARSVAEGIENGLARYVYYQKENISNEDLIYRVEGGNLMNDVENKFSNSSVKQIDDYNKLDENKGYVYMDDTLRNPNIELLQAFNLNNHISLKTERTNKLS